MNKRELKEKFISYFGEEKWNEEKQLTKLLKFQIYVANYLGVDVIPVIVEDIVEDSRYYLEEAYIVISKKLINDEIEAAKCIAHEMRHHYQWYIIKNNIDHRFKDEWKKNLSKTININPNLVDDIANYDSSLIELDAFAFQKYIIKKYYGLDIYHPIIEYDTILEFYIEKYF